MRVLDISVRLLQTEREVSNPVDCIFDSGRESNC